MNYTTSIDEYYSNLRESSPKDERIGYWAHKNVADYPSLAPDSKGHMNGLKADRTLSSVATQYYMHPLMLSWWTCLIGKVVSDVGEAQTEELLKDDNSTTVEALNRHIARYGEQVAAFDHSPGCSGEH